jgi:hypothetical protein
MKNNNNNINNNFDDNYFYLISPKKTNTNFLEKKLIDFNNIYLLKSKYSNKLIKSFTSNKYSCNDNDILLKSNENENFISYKKMNFMPIYNSRINYSKNNKDNNLNFNKDNDNDKDNDLNSALLENPYIINAEKNDKRIINSNLITDFNNKNFIINYIPEKNIDFIIDNYNNNNNNYNDYYLFLQKKIEKNDNKKIYFDNYSSKKNIYHNIIKKSKISNENNICLNKESYIYNTSYTNFKEEKIIQNENKNKKDLYRPNQIFPLNINNNNNNDNIDNDIDIKFYNDIKIK